MILLIAENATAHVEQDNLKLMSEKDIDTVYLNKCDHVTIVHGCIEHAPFHIPDVPYIKSVCNLLTLVLED